MIGDGPLVEIRAVSPLIAAFLAVEIAVAVLAVLPVPWIPVPRGVLSDYDQGQTAWPSQIGAPNSWVRLSDGQG